MEFSLLIPEWFGGYDAFLEAVFLVITLLLSVYSFRVYRLTKNRESRLVGLSFLLLALSYLSLSLTTGLFGALLVVNPLDLLSGITQIGLVAYMLLFIGGLITMTYLTTKSKGNRLYLLLLLPALLAILKSTNAFFIFLILSSFYLLFIVIFYYNIYKKNKQKNTLFILLAFLFLLIGKVQYIFTINFELFYVIGHFLELVAYILMLVTLVRIMRK
ncbi:hypothetical protein ACFLZX_02900 [Nanoarchaeota archaeon]